MMLSVAISNLCSACCGGVRGSSLIGVLHDIDRMFFSYQYSILTAGPGAPGDPAAPAGPCIPIEP